MTTPRNPALRQELLSQKPLVIPPRENESMFEWLESTGRFKPYETVEEILYKPVEELEEIMDAPLYGVDKEEEEDWGGED
jgi:spore coat protein CotF